MKKKEVKLTKYVTTKISSNNNVEIRRGGGGNQTRGSKRRKKKEIDKDNQICNGKWFWDFGNSAPTHFLRRKPKWQKRQYKKSIKIKKRKDAFLLRICLPFFLFYTLLTSSALIYLAESKTNTIWSNELPPFWPCDDWWLRFDNEYSITNEYKWGNINNNDILINVYLISISIIIIATPLVVIVLLMDGKNNVFFIHIHMSWYGNAKLI